MILHLIFALGHVFLTGSLSSIMQTTQMELNCQSWGKGDIGQMSNVKINEFLISSCKKKNYFLISAQPSKNLPSLSNKIQWNCAGCRERQKAGQTDSRGSK